MVRPRFAKLPPAQQQAILGAALDEFAAYGFYDASLNRVIEAAGISKGSMYYYFDDKEDLFAHVVRVEFERLFAALGAVALPPEPGPDAFWSAVQAYYLDAMAAMAARPQLAALVRGWLAASDNPALQRAQHDMEQEILPGVERVLAMGQAAGAVRDDLPPDRGRPWHGQGDGPVVDDPAARRHRTARAGRRAHRDDPQSAAVLIPVPPRRPRGSPGFVDARLLEPPHSSSAVGLLVAVTSRKSEAVADRLIAARTLVAAYDRPFAHVPGTKNACWVPERGHAG
jgi:AcrR family transcriptional regulator